METKPIVANDIVRFVVDLEEAIKDGWSVRLDNDGAPSMIGFSTFQVYVEKQSANEQDAPKKAGRPKKEVTEE